MIGSVSWLLVDKVLRVASGVLVSTAVARHLGPNDYGVLALAVGAVGIATAAANMGADHINLAELARSQSSSLLASAFAVRLVWSLVCAGAVIVLSAGADAETALVFAALSISIVAAAPMIFTHQLYADGRFRIASLLAMSAVIFGAVARIAGVVLQADLSWFAWCVSLEAAALGCSALVWSAFDGKRWQPSALSRHEALRYLRLCLPTLASAILVAVYFRVELFVIGGLLGREAAGTWAAAMMFILPWNMVSAAVLPVLNRRLGARQPGAEIDTTAMVRMLRIMLVVATAAALLNAMAVHAIVPLLLGERYAAAADVATIGSMALVPLFFGAVQDVWLAQRRRTKVVLLKVMVGLPLSVALLMAGVWRAELIGAAVAMVLSYAVTSIVLNAWIDRRFFQLQLAAMGLRRER